MAKIEEITAVLIEEIKSFELAVSKLQATSIEIQNLEIKTDTSNIDSKFTELLSNIDTSYKKQQQELIVLREKLNKTFVLPKWITFVLILFISSIGINFYQHNSIKKKQEISYQNGRNEVYNKIQLFFNDNPQALKTYKNWTKK